MRRIIGLVAAVAVFVVAFGLTGEGGLQTPQNAEATESVTTWYYPFGGADGVVVPANGPAETTAPFQPAACTNCYITRIEPELIYMDDPDPVNHPDGSSANFNNSSLHGVWMHHMVLVDACDGALPRVFASGNERTIFQAPTGYGIHQTCASWHLNYHIHNSSSAARTVALKLTITYRTGETLTPLKPFWMDTSNSGDGEFTIPEGYSDTHTGSGAPGISPDWTSNMQGRIMTIGGHVHNYGISTAAYNNRLGDYICTSVGGYGTGSRYLPSGGAGTAGHPAAGNALTLNTAYHEPGGTPDNKHHIQQVTPCSPTAVQSIICIGDVIRLHTQYNNTSGFPVFDAMGIMAGQVDTSLPDSDSDGTIDQCDDPDSDGVITVQDNCPHWANPTQTMPPWPVPAGDEDCDGYPSTVASGGRAPETTITTSQLSHCASNATANNEPTPDAWPLDFNDDQKATILDVSQYSSRFGAVGPNPPYSVRYDLNGSGSITITDISQFSASFGKSCSP
jgi:hypothetical protein